MPGRSRCEEPKTLWRSQRRGTDSTDTGAGHYSSTPARQVASRSDSGLARIRQAEEGRVTRESPTADGRRKDSSSTASCRYSLRSRSSLTRTPTRETRGGPGVSPATSPAKGKAKKTEDGQKAEERGVRAAQATKPVSRTKKSLPSPAQRQKQSAITSGLLSTREIQRFGTWNVRTLRGLGKTEQLAREMKRYRLSILAVTETHLPGDGEMTLEEGGDYTMIFSGRQDESNVEGVGLACSHCSSKSHNAIPPSCVFQSAGGRVPHTSGSFADCCGICSY